MKTNKFLLGALCSFAVAGLMMVAAPRAHALFGIGADAKVDANITAEHQNGDDRGNDKDGEWNNNSGKDDRDDKKSGDTSDGRMYKGDDHSSGQAEVKVGFWARFGDFFKNFFKFKNSTAINAHLEDKSYALTSYNGTTIASDQKYIISFDDGKVSVKFCNSMNGSYSIKSGMISGQLMSTMMYCDQPANLMTMESAFGKIMAEGATIAYHDQTITITGKANGEIFVFTRE